MRHGDTCEIMTLKTQRPNKDWLDFVKTSKAKTKIRAELRSIERERSLQIGRELVEKEFKRFGEPMSKYLKNDAIAEAFKDSKHRTLDELFIAVGYGKLAPQLIVERVLPRVPLRRWGVPGDFGAIAVYLASDASAYHTGDTFIIDGGYSVF